MKRMLYKQDYQLLLAKSGAKALELMQQHEVHLIISDMKCLLCPEPSYWKRCPRLILIPTVFYYQVILIWNRQLMRLIKENPFFLQRPWDNDEITNVIQQGLEKVRLK